MAKKQLPSERVMLLLPRPLLHFVDDLAKQLSTSYQTVNRQTAIRHCLEKLAVEMSDRPAKKRLPS